MDNVSHENGTLTRAIRIDKFLKSKKVLILYGARRVGRTTLKYQIDSGDNIPIQHFFASQDFQTIMEYAEGYDLVAIDEAQQIKIIVI